MAKIKVPTSSSYKPLSLFRKHAYIKWLVLALFGIFIVYFFANSQYASPTPQTNFTSAELKNLILSSNSINVFRRYGIATVTLTGKTTQFGDPVNESQKPYGSVTLGDIFVGTDKEIITTLGIVNEESPEIVYLSAFEPENGVYNVIAGWQLGEDVVVDSLSVQKNGLLSVKFQKSGKDTEWWFRYNDMQLSRCYLGYGFRLISAICL